MPGNHVVGIVGSREGIRQSLVQDFVIRLHEKHPTAIVVSGGAKGVDQWAEATARSRGMDLISYRPYEYENMNYEREFSIETVTEGERAMAIVVAKHRRINPPFFRTYGQACYFRNAWIVDDATEVVGFWNGKSPGTRNALELAERAAKPVFRR